MVFLLIFLFLPLNSWGQSSTSKTQKTITIQVVSLKNVEKAEQELARLKSHGLNPFMRHELVPDKGMWYRVYVGRFEERDEAKIFAQKIKAQGLISGFWVKQIEMPVEPIKPSQTIIAPPVKPEMKVDTGPEMPASPSIGVEMPKTVIPPEEKPSLPQPPVRKPEVIIPDKTQEPASPTKKEIKDILPADDVPEAEPISPIQSIADQRPEKQVEMGRLSVGLKSRYFIASKAEDFIIERTSGSDHNAWSFENAAVYNALISNYRLNSTFSIEAAIEKAFFTKLDIWHLNMGPKFEFSKINMLTPYARGGLVMGHLEWDEVPGDFDTAFGWEGGFGISFVKSNIQIGLEASYRALIYDYNPPSDAGVTATDNQLDFSGYALSGTLSYWF